METISSARFVECNLSALKKESAFVAGKGIRGQTNILKETPTSAPKKFFSKMFNKSPDVISGGRLFKLLV